MPCCRSAIASCCPASAPSAKDGSPARGRLRRCDPQRMVAEEARPLLGICLGMQMLAEQPARRAAQRAAWVGPGRACSRLDDTRLHAAHPARRLERGAARTRSDPLFAGIPNGTDFYFVHSFAFEPETTRTVSARTDYGVPVTAAVQTGACLRHAVSPGEKLEGGRRLLRNFLDTAVLKVRVIPTLLWKNLGWSRAWASTAGAGSAQCLPAIKVYNPREVDELVLVDITAHPTASEPDHESVDDFARRLQRRRSRSAAASLTS